jgi:hypothetical protein
VDEQTRDELVCAAANKTECGSSFRSLKLLHFVEMLIFLLCLVQVSRLFFTNTTSIFFASILAIYFSRDSPFSTILTEPLFLATSGVFLLMWVKALMEPARFRNWVASGVALGAAAMVKPAWAILPFCCVAMLFVFATLRTGSPRTSTAMARPYTVRGFVFLISYIAVVSPFMLRNYLTVGVLSMGDPAYLVNNFTYRAAYNMMTAREWLAGWIEYFPLLGGRVVSALFDDLTAKRLAWDEYSFYVLGGSTLMQEVMSSGNPMLHLLKTYVLEMPVKFVLVSLLLMWRGLFISGQLGALAVLCAIPVLSHMRKPERAKIWLLSAPIICMVAVNACVSVSIARYNVPLIIIYCLIFGQMVDWTMDSLLSHKLKTRFLAAAARLDVWISKSFSRPREPSSAPQQS